MPFGTNANDSLFGVFDRHGKFGAECSQFVKRSLFENLQRNDHFHVGTIKAYHAAFLATNAQLHASDSVVDSMSGTTAFTVWVRDRTKYMAGTGDSRAVIARRKDSADPPPNWARVLTLDQIQGLKNLNVQCSNDSNPPRLWVPNGMYPGTAFKRSIGDSVAGTIGVIVNPEIVALELTPEYPFFVIAGDGIDMVASTKILAMPALQLLLNSIVSGCSMIHESRTDDISIIVVHITGLASTFDPSPLGVTSTVWRCNV